MEGQPKRQKKSAKETGRWTKDEHSRFILGLINHGKNWKMVEGLVATRTSAQVRSHAQKFFNRLSKVRETFKEQLEEQEGVVVGPAVLDKLLDSAKETDLKSTVKS